MRVLVTAASTHGATGEIAQTIGDVLAGRGLDAFRGLEGNFRDRAAVEAWASRIADALQSGS